MDYEKLRTKYATDSGVRSGRRRSYQNDVKIALNFVDDIDAELKRLQPVQAGQLMTAEAAARRDQLLFERQDALKNLQAAKEALNAFECEVVDVEAIADRITH